MSTLRLFTILLLLLFRIQTLAAADQPYIEITQDGIQVELDGVETFNIEGPYIIDNAGGRIEGNFSIQNSKSALIQYPGGAEVEISLDAARAELHYQINEFPEVNYNGFRIAVLLPLFYGNGWSFVLGDDAPRLFPKKLEQARYQTMGESFSILSPNGSGVQFETTKGLQVLQDNRQYGWSRYQYTYELRQLKKGHEDEFTIELASVRATSDSDVAILDAFGQLKALDYSDKVQSVDELKSDIEADRQYYESYPELNRSVYGGDDAVRLEATGFFRVDEWQGRKVMVDPKGNLFFQLGVCGIQSHDDATFVTGREEIYDWLPSFNSEYKSAFFRQNPSNFSFYRANWIRKNEKEFNYLDWSREAIKRLRKIGFNSAGAWAEITDAYAEEEFPYSVMLNSFAFGELAKVPGLKATVFDPFAENVEANLRDAFRRYVAPEAENPLIIGYFLGNEANYQDIPRIVPALNGSHPAKVEMVKLLREKYATIDAFNKAWEPENDFQDFDSLLDVKLMPTTESAYRDMSAYLRHFLEAYFGTVTRLFREYDPNHLLLGDRLMPSTCSNRDVLEVSGKYMDVISVNYYTFGLDPNFLSRVHRLTGGRPLILSEWFFSASTQGAIGGREVDSQEERGMAYRHYVENAATLPYVVGQQWFTYLDQSLTGRFFQKLNGEAANTGLINVVDRPYKTLMQYAYQTHRDIYKVMMGEKAPYQFDDPRFIYDQRDRSKMVAAPHVPGKVQLDGLINDWPGVPGEPISSSRITYGVEDPEFFADFRVAWDEKYFYFFVHVNDTTPRQNAQPLHRSWDADCVEFFIGPASDEEVIARRLSDRQFMIHSNLAEAIVLPEGETREWGELVLVDDVNGKGYSIEMAVRWDYLNLRPEEGLELMFDVAVDDSTAGHRRVRQIIWNGDARASSDPSTWGRVKLVR
ncbi:sugar-binding protein [Puniceicoccus vermicola]|uniref:Carbohydrate-binding domain-containing protein n=1 Tax=Puniceicoccus vermicola TaxID=388746 RepID=A0A7X1E4W8_9BACT|nr:sugar-binding protein [Puniceicoccus vermicola]MBC2602975.1 hypothetical protein [Puniceicoccus vermicola]